MAMKKGRIEEIRGEKYLVVAEKGSIRCFFCGTCLTCPSNLPHHCTKHDQRDKETIEFNVKTNDERIEELAGMTYDEFMEDIKKRYPHKDYSRIKFLPFARIYTDSRGNPFN